MIERTAYEQIERSISMKPVTLITGAMQVVASLSGQELIYDNIAKVVGIYMMTYRSWDGVLISTELVFLLQPYAEWSTVKKVVKRPKLYFWDTGLACHLARIPDEN